MGPINIFCSYVEEDEKFLRELEKHLGILKRSNLINTWHSQILQSDINRKQEINKHLESANIILLLISNYFLESDYYSVPEIKRALERHNSGEASVILILLSPVALEQTPFKQLAVLPTEGKAVIEWQDRDAAFLNISEGIRKAVTTIRISSFAKEKPSIKTPDLQTKNIALKEAVETQESDYRFREIAKWFQRRKQLNRRTVLVLGARAGGLFRSNYLYEELQFFSTRAFNNLSRLEQFRECYSILTGSLFSEMDLHNILRAALQKLTIARADVCLAELVKLGYFDEIVTTNIDDILEQSLFAVEMKEYSEFEVATPMITKDEQIQVERSRPVRITKIFGDFASRNYSIKRYASTSSTTHQNIKSSLQPMLARDILVVGLDPIWDQELIRAMPAGAGTIWFVNEEVSDEHALAASFPQERHVVYIKGRDGSYEHFMRKLHFMLLGDISSNAQFTNDILYRLHDLEEKLRVLQDQNKLLRSEIANLQKNRSSNSSQTQDE